LSADARGVQGGGWPQYVHFGGGAPVDRNKQPLTTRVQRDMILIDL
jgi:hypothetical protein